MQRVIDKYLMQLPLTVTDDLQGVKAPNVRSVIIPEQPRGKARPRMNRRGRVYTPTATSMAETLVKAIAITQCPTPGFDQPVRLELLAIMPVPQSWTQAKKKQALAGIIRPAVTPDFDNIAKLYCDALNGSLWKDDRQIVDGRCIKCYGEKPAVIIWCWPV